MKLKLYYIVVFCLLANVCGKAQPADTSKWWHNKVRHIHYQPKGNDFVLVNGKQRFNRALYGTNTAFRVEAGDLPEFALYMPGMGGNFKFGLVAGDRSKWIIHAKNIKTIYRPGSMLYEIRDSMLGKGVMNITIMALADAEGLIVKTTFSNVPSQVKLIWVYGGASGKKFNRDGDIGADPESSFYLHPEYCRDNVFKISQNKFALYYGSGKVLSEEDRYGNKPAGNAVSSAVVGEKNAQKQLNGIFPPVSIVHEADAVKQNSPLELFQSNPSATPVVAGSMDVTKEAFYFLVKNPASNGMEIAYRDLRKEFDKAESARKLLAERIRVITPDPFVNTLGGALSIAADAIWEEPSYMHGSIAWRMRLPAWRGPYVADPLGWHDRARMHFSSYANSQVTSPDSGPVVADTALHLARQLEKMGTSVFSNGYISRNPNSNKVPHHYDMNLVYVDELLNHFNWTGDLDFVKKMWPLLQRHLAWEKRNFDVDGDGLYDAYAAIWASDALQYSGGGVTHSSAYNYRANKAAAEIAKLIGEDGSSYQSEADKILQAMNTVLWMPAKGWYAEYKDLLGLKQLHPAAALWTIYHAIDEKAVDGFRAYQSLQYIDNHIPHIPVKANGLERKDLYVLSTTNWHPYEWSLNNVALAESQHTALAYWQGGRSNEAYKIWESSLIESMYLGASPGGLQQLTYYDAVRGELYRDFADGIGMTARALVEGLFGVNPDALKNTLTLQPGWPEQWKHATLKIPDVQIDFRNEGNNDVYTILPSFQTNMKLRLQVKAKRAGVTRILINGKSATWKSVDDVVGDPMMEITANYQKKYVVHIEWQQQKLAKANLQNSYVKGSKLFLRYPDAVVKKIADPQNILLDAGIKDNSLQATINGDAGNFTAFVQLQQNRLTWWQPLDILVKDEVEIIAPLQQQKNSIQFSINNNTAVVKAGKVVVNKGLNAYEMNLIVAASTKSETVVVPPGNLVGGSNRITFSWKDESAEKRVEQNIINWSIDSKLQSFDAIDLAKYFNDKVTQIFKNQYLSPRPAVPTLQLPTQGIGEWTHPLITANIVDSGLRKLAGKNNQVTLPHGIVFKTPSDTNSANIIFTSQWDNYPKQVTVPLSGKASHAYLLMAGSTNPMQSRLVNGRVIINYDDGTSDSLLLKNPETWWPIEQDYYNDGYAFNTNATRPVRIHLKTGNIISDAETSISNNKGKMIDGGAATVLDMPLHPAKTLKEIRLHTSANDVVIGLMSLTLVR